MVDHFGHKIGVTTTIEDKKGSLNKLKSIVNKQKTKISMVSAFTSIFEAVKKEYKKNYKSLIQEALNPDFVVYLSQDQKFKHREN